jgi:hypothetical protein
VRGQSFSILHCPSVPWTCAVGQSATPLSMRFSQWSHQAIRIRSKSGRAHSAGLMFV